MSASLVLGYDIISPIQDGHFRGWSRMGGTKKTPRP